ncbi:MAG: hypothetical protein KatS3mg037_1530 [Ignavibacterium sp.]|nr:MAG: hypothetical protein KatS3mg037_1530 [Ignavibacterium sp.]
MLVTISTVKAQIIIKEKVEINPETITPEYAAPQYTPCGPWIASYDRLNPWQVVWNSISFAPDPYQQMFNFQDNRYGPGLQRRTYKFDPDKTYNITLQQSDEYAYFTYGGFYDNTTGSYVPIQYVGTTLDGVLGSDLGATSIYDYVQDYPNGLYHNDSKYRLRIKRNVPLGTEIIMTVFDGQETINYHTRVETPTFTIESRAAEDDLLHYYSRDIEFWLNFQHSCQLDGYGGAYPEGIKFNVEIVQGQEYGNLYYPGTVAEPEQSGTSITNLEDEYGMGIATYTIKYKADGIQPDESNPGIVTIRCTANDLDIAPVEVSFPVVYNEDPPDEGGVIVVEFDKDSYQPGETAIANCRWLTGYNELIDFPSEQIFNVEITGGSEYGELQNPVSGEVGTRLEAVSNGFRVLTATEIAEEEVRIILRVSTIVGGGIATRPANKKGSEEEKTIDKEVKQKEPIIPELIIIGGEEEIVGFGTVVVRKVECDEEIVVCENPQPQMLDMNSIEFYKENDIFHTWLYDPLGNEITYYVQGCEFKSKEKGKISLGVTLLIPGMPLFKSLSGPFDWKTESEVEFRTCVHQNENRWIINVERLRIPVFSSSCINNPPEPYFEFIDLGDGSDILLLENNIPDRETFDMVMRDLEYWKTPLERFKRYPEKFVFKSGIQRHEDYHGILEAENIKMLFNGYFQILFNANYSLNTYKCPEDLLRIIESQMRANIGAKRDEAFYRYTNLGANGQKNEEMECDKYAVSEYEAIEKRIINWAKNKTWY